jgi:hypothetical protein
VRRDLFPCEFPYRIAEKLLVVFQLGERHNR